MEFGRRAPFYPSSSASAFRRCADDMPHRLGQSQEGLALSLSSLLPLGLSLHLPLVLSLLTPLLCTGCYFFYHLYMCTYESDVCVCCVCCVGGRVSVEARRGLWLSLGA